MTVILVWNNNMVTAGHEYPGHSSLLIGDDWTSGIDFVSWFPGGSEDAGGRIASRNKTLLEDLECEGYAPDHIIRMPETLNKADMRTKWKEIRLKANGHYKFYRKNCSTIVARVLRSGTNSGSLIKRHNVIWTPLKIKRFALEIGGQERSWEWLLGHARVGGLITSLEEVMLFSLRKRDARHGKAGGTGSYFAQGYRIAPKVAMVSGVSGEESLKFAINTDATTGAIAIVDGNLYTGNNLRQIGDRIDAS